MFNKTLNVIYDNCILNYITESIQVQKVNGLSVISYVQLIKTFFVGYIIELLKFANKI